MPKLVEGLDEVANAADNLAPVSPARSSSPRNLLGGASNNADGSLRRLRSAASSSSSSDTKRKTPLPGLNLPAQPEPEVRKLKAVLPFDPNTLSPRPDKGQAIQADKGKAVARPSNVAFAPGSPEPPLTTPIRPEVLQVVGNGGNTGKERVRLDGLPEPPRPVEVDLRIRLAQLQRERMAERMRTFNFAEREDHEVRARVKMREQRRRRNGESARSKEELEQEIASILHRRWKIYLEQTELGKVHNPGAKSHPQRPEKGVPVGWKEWVQGSQDVINPGSPSSSGLQAQEAPRLPRREYRHMQEQDMEEPEVVNPASPAKPSPPRPRVQLRGGLQAYQGWGRGDAGLTLRPPSTSTSAPEAAPNHARASSAALESQSRPSETNRAFNTPGASSSHATSPQAASPRSTFPPQNTSETRGRIVSAPAAPLTPKLSYVREPSRGEGLDKP